MRSGRAVVVGRGWWVAAALLLAALACATAATRLSADDSDAPVTVAALAAEDAVRQAVQATGAVYAGDCAATRSPADLGKVCSKLVEERESQRAYLTGRTFSEFSEWVFVEQTAGGWVLAGSAPLDFFATSIEVPWP